MSLLEDDAGLWKYILESYPEVTDKRIDNDHWDIFCQKCNRTCGFQVVTLQYVTTTGQYSGYSPPNLTYPYTTCFRCPVCASFKLWILFRKNFDAKREDGSTYGKTRYFRVTSLPSEGVEDLDALPVEPAALRTAYKQAVRAMDANAHIAAAAMFRRALQVITRNILGAKPGNLANELSEVVGKTYNGVTIAKNFSDNAYVIKESGNQGAHPDKDPDLLDFTDQDAKDLQDIFMELVADLFVVPTAKKKAREGFMQRRKITAPAVAK